MAIIRLLDVRFPPNASISEQDRETQVLLLASDVAGIHPRLLDAVAQEWVRTKAFMPKASELHNMAAAMRQAAGSRDEGERVEIGRRVAANYNARLAGEARDKGIRWIYDAKADSLRLVPIDEYRAMQVAA